MRSLPVSIATAVLMLAGAAAAHPRLVAASPAPNSTVAKPARVQLRFSEGLMPAFSKADLAMAGANGRPATPVPSTSTVAADGRTLVIAPGGPLRRGRYTIRWRVVSTDTHRVAGGYVFAVR